MRNLRQILVSLLLLCSIVPLTVGRAQAGALIHTVITGRTIALDYYHGRLVRLTVRRLSGIQSQRYVVVRRDTKVYYEGREGENPHYPDIIRKGMIVRAEGGLTQKM